TLIRSHSLKVCIICDEGCDLCLELRYLSENCGQDLIVLGDGSILLTLPGNTLRSLLLLLRYPSRAGTPTRCPKREHQEQEGGEGDPQLATVPLRVAKR